MNFKLMFRATGSKIRKGRLCNLAIRICLIFSNKSQPLVMQNQRTDSSGNSAGQTKIIHVVFSILLKCGRNLSYSKLPGNY
ncbi:MAG: hypothetical protein C5B59_06065 [Bacteroidetes bacterium]|nr:MAG: hypothetical protein C5B59_06065 [Bacteroidota bacterium]